MAKEAANATASGLNLATLQNLTAGFDAKSVKEALSKVKLGLSPSDLATLGTLAKWAPQVARFGVPAAAAIGVVGTLGYAGKKAYDWYMDHPDVKHKEDAAKAYETRIRAMRESEHFSNLNPEIRERFLALYGTDDKLEDGVPNLTEKQEEVLVTEAVDQEEYKSEAERFEMLSKALGITRTLNGNAGDSVLGELFHFFEMYQTKPEKFVRVLNERDSLVQRGYI